MPSVRCDRYVVGLVLLMNLERFRERHFGRGLVPSGNLLLAMLAQKFCELHFGHREMRSTQTLPNFFPVAKCPGIVAAGFMAHQVLLAGFFPRLNGPGCPNGTQGCALCGYRTFCPVCWIQRSRTPLAAQTASLCSFFWATRPLRAGFYQRFSWFSIALHRDRRKQP